MRLSEAAAVTRGALRGDDALFTGVGMDSREIRAGDLFVAITGERDGHDFVAQAGERGAAGALVSKTGVGKGAPRNIAQIRVSDTTAAVGQLGAHWRRRFKSDASERPLVAVTGSNGKTTVCALIAAIFNRAGDCLAPRASFNNQWGVPLTLLRMRERHTHAVIEMGMNHRGEIAYLSDLAQPDIALINNVTTAHLAGLGDLQNIADAKAEIFSGLAPDGIAVLNADDRFHDHWSRELAKKGVTNIVRFSAQPDAATAIDVRAVSISNGHFELDIAGQRAPVELALPGKHNIANAAAAAAAAHAAGINIEQIQAALNAFPGALPGRLAAFTGVHGAALIDDSYNANPTSCKAALDVLAGYEGMRIAVLGAMAELGGQSDELHYEVGQHARAVGIEHLLCLGAATDSGITNYLHGFGHEQGERFEQLDALIQRLAPMLEAQSPATVLVKGSRAAAMERVTARLKANSNPPGPGGASC